MKIAILGYGVIGSGVYELLNKNSEAITKKIGEKVEVKRVLDLRVFKDDPVSSILTHDFNDILNDDEIETVVETMGGTGAAYKFVKECMLKGKNVCTSNKALIAKYGSELLAIAVEKQINLFFEASVGGGIPIIRPLRQCLTPDNIEKIDGILNGTTNYILSRMFESGTDFKTALTEAQNKGYAEANPAADIEGADAARKIAILASIVCGHQIEFEDIYTIGIDKITAEDISYAKKLGGAIKLIAGAEFDGILPKITVVPKLLFDESPLYHVRGVTNSIVVSGNMLGDVIFTGSGAGKLPTASAVVADVLDTIRNRNRNIYLKWNPEKLAQQTKETLVFSNLVIVADEDIDKLKENFEIIREIECEQLSGEKAFVLAGITEAEFDNRAEGISFKFRFRL